MKHSILIILGCINSYLSYAQCFHGEYTTEWQWDMKKETNWVNQGEKHFLHDAAFGKHMPQEWLLPIR